MRYHFGPFTLDARRRRLYRGNEPVPLTPKGIDTLLALIECAGGIVEKDDLIERLWPDTVVTEANLTQHVFTLRKALGNESYIVTVPRRGYRFVADVRREEAAAPRMPAPPRVGRFTLALPPERPAARLTTPALAISPDGVVLVYVARVDGDTLLCRRMLDRLDVETISGTEGASNPFWSPDGAWIAFAGRGRLWRVRRDGGQAQAMTDAADCRGATWTVDDSLIYSPGPAECLWIARSDGAGGRPLTRVDFEAGERTHRWPTALPDGRVVFTIGSAGIATFDDAALALIVSRTGERRTWLTRASDPRWLGGSSMAFLRDGVVWRADLDSDQVTPLLDGVAIESTGIAQYAIVPGGGVTVYMPGGRQPIRRDLVWTDTNGAVQPSGVPPGEVEEPRVSPDGQRIAFGARSGTSDIWIFDTRRGACTRVTSEGDNFAPVWTPDGDAIAFSSNRLGCGAIFMAPADGSGDPRLLVRSEHDLVPGSWSPNGERLLYTEYHPNTGADIWVVTRGGDATPVLVTAFNEYSPAWSPDGTWFAFTGDESGTPQIYLRRFPSGTKVQVSVHGGTEPVWPRSSDQLFFRSGANLAASRIVTGATYDVSPPRIILATAGEAGTMTGLPNYDVTPDAKRVLIVRSQARATSSPALQVLVPLSSSQPTVS